MSTFSLSLSPSPISSCSSSIYATRTPSSTTSIFLNLTHITTTYSILLMAERMAELPCLTTATSTSASYSARRAEQGELGGISDVGAMGWSLAAVAIEIFLWVLVIG
jgi:hypothetical protein